MLSKTEIQPVDPTLCLLIGFRFTCNVTYCWGSPLCTFGQSSELESSFGLSCRRVHLLASMLNFVDGDTNDNEITDPDQFFVQSEISYEDDTSATEFALFPLSQIVRN